MSRLSVEPDATLNGKATLRIGALRYRAFISYSHRDEDIARWLHRSLEKYRVPSRLRGSIGEFGALPERLTPIFRDREDLASAGELGPRIEEALADSEALIVICSPDAARSSWANDEVLAFKRLGRTDRIYSLIVNGEPGDAQAECFPHALRFDLDDNGDIGIHPAEPLAADLRAGKDGKSLAFLKIISGLLGVPLDTLRQREAARRHRRMLAITALSVLVMLVTSALAVEAVIQRHAAERRQKQAEVLVDFMLGDLTDKLSQVSRLDILESVDDHAMNYFKSLPTTDVTDQALMQRATAFENIGNVRRDQGHLPKALESYQAAAALTGQLAKEAPGDTKRQLAYAEALSYIGTAHWYQGELDQAKSGFEAAQALLKRAQDSRKTNAVLEPALLYQLAGLDNNIGHVLEARGLLDKATAQYKDMLVASNQLIALDSARSVRSDWMSLPGLAHNNLAKMALLRGDLAAAESEYQADLDIETALARRDPSNNSQAEKVLISQATLGRTLAMTGDVTAGINQMRHALDQVARLLNIEPNGTVFAEDEGLYSSQLARLLRLSGDMAGANALTSQSLAVLGKLSKQDPGNAGWQQELAEALIEQATQSRQTGDTTAAREQVQSALAILEPQLANQANDRSTVLAILAARLLLADVSASTASATKLREQALQTIQSQVSGRNDPRLRVLLASALFGLGRHGDAATLSSTLWHDGFHDPAFVALLRKQGVTLPAIPTAAPARSATPHRP